MNQSCAFGPVPSRRLGRSLGINNIPPKVCTYSCVYCQLGRTLDLRLERGSFYEPEKILRDVSDKIRRARRKGEKADYLTFVPDGEPTLDLNLAEAIERLRKIGSRIAVITNSSLIWSKKVRDALSRADWVSLKIDALSPDVWKQINRPHGGLSLDKILAGIVEFARAFKGQLATETMIVRGINDRAEEIERISDFIVDIRPKVSYLAVPIRPPAEKWVKPPSESILNMAYQVFADHSIPTEYLIGCEGTAFAWTGNVKEDLLSITAVHPIREDAVRELLKKANATWTVIGDLVKEKKLAPTKFGHNTFYIRNLAGLRKTGMGRDAKIAGRHSRS